MSTEVLLAHARFLQGLSKALVRDEHLADDLVQDTWAAALRSPPVEPDSCRSWLARVMRNLAVNVARRESRRRKRERAASRREVLASAAEIAEREEVARRVIQAVFRLEEPYRSVILHRFYEALPPRRIARLQSLPVETVRTRLKRALERLRRDLDCDFGRRSAWAVPLLVFPGRDLAVTTASGAALSVPELAGNTFSLGALLMSTKTLILSVGVTVVLGITCGLLYRGLSSEERRTAALAQDRDALKHRVLELGSEARRLREELARAGSREADLWEQIEALAAEAREKAPRPSEAEPADGQHVAADRAHEVHLDSLDEAEALALNLIAQGDLEGLLALAAELMRQGEPGYQKVLDLFPVFERSFGDDSESPLRLICSQGELVMGTVIRAMAEHHQELLRFLVWLDGVPEAQRAGEIMKGAPDLLSGELGLMLLGHDDGQDPHLLSGLVNIYRRRLSRDLEAGRADRELLLAIGHIRTDEATQLLSHALPQLAPKLQRTAVEALTWQRSPSAVPALQEVLATTADPQLAEVTGLAIRHIQASQSR